MPQSIRDLDAVELLAELHRRQGEMYAGGSLDPVAELLPQDVIWHVGGHSPISVSHRGIEQVLAYFERRRRFVENSLRMHPRDVLFDGDPVVQLVDGSAEIDGKATNWRSVGIYRVDLEHHWIREVWLHPLDRDQFDRIWSPGSRMA